MDIKGFFDNIDHELMMRAVRKHTQEKWILLYIERWLKAPAQLKNGTIMRRNLGTPQGGCISPLIANIFLHHAFDEWIKKTYPWIPFERYADDIIVHCRTEAEAIQLKERIERRLSLCKLELHPEKTKIVYCKNSRRKENYSNISFDFLGYTFRPRSSVNRKGIRFTGFLPAISRNAIKSINDKIRAWKLHQRTDLSLVDIIIKISPIVQGWVNYYGRFYKSALYSIASRIEGVMVKWAKKKFKRFKTSYKKAREWLTKIAKGNPEMFVMWNLSNKVIG
jgi:RNA-directed DNA polymerase